MRVLRRAAELLGSERALARELRVPLRELFAWLEGAERPARPAFLTAVDILIDQGDPGSFGAGASQSPPANDERPGSFFRSEEEKKA
jgi:hypothetical protein